MIICILAADENIKEVRESAKQIPQFAKHTALAIPVSPTGEMPVTHWFCTFKASEEVYQQIKDLQHFTEVVESAPRAFLEGRNLKIIPMDKLKEE